MAIQIKKTFYIYKNQKKVDKNLGVTNEHTYRFVANFTQNSKMFVNLHETRTVSILDYKQLVTEEGHMANGSNRTK